jgi:hypothetical protein
MSMTKLKKWIVTWLVFSLLFFLHGADTGTNSATVEAIPNVPSHVYTLFDIAWVLALFGAFGGMLAALSEASLREIRENGIKAYGTRGRFLSCLAIGALWGMGGAMAFGAIASLDNKFENFDEAKRISFAFLSVATGFAGLQFLILISRRLSKEVNEAVKQETDKVRQEMVDNNEKQAKRLEELNDAISALSHALTIPATDLLFPSIVGEAKRKGHKAFQTSSTHRPLVILLARLECECVNKNNYESAINILSEAIGDWRRKKDPFNIDFAALLYNRACYSNKHADSFAEKGNGAKSEEWKERAWKDLQESCKHDKHNKDEAVNDPFLASIINNGTRKWTAL